MKLNGDEIEIDEWKDDWALALMEQGVIVKLGISRWSAVSRLNYEELGITFNDSEHKEFMSQYVSLGSEKLLPPDILKEIKNVEVKARVLLSNYSFQTVWGRFVPYSVLADWKSESDELKQEFLNMGRNIGQNYDSIIREVKRDYEKLAEDVWRRCYPSSNQSPPASFLNNFTSKIIEKIPEREKIVASFKYETIFFKIPLPSFIQNDIAKAEKIVLDREKEAHSTLVDMETKNIVAEEYRERKKELVDSFLESTVVFLRHHVAELAEHTYQVLQRRDRDITAHEAQKIKLMIKKVRTLNFHNDEEIETILNDLKNEVSRYKGERDKVVITTKLRELVDLAKEEYMPEGFNPIIDIIDIN